MYFPVKKGFSPEPKVKYTVVLDSEERVDIYFTEKNRVFDKERHMGYYQLECLDKNKKRFVCHISECYCESDVLIIYLDPDDYCIDTNKMMGVDKIYINETELVYRLD